jgi:hypothetical protein
MQDINNADIISRKVQSISSEPILKPIVHSNSSSFPRLLIFQKASRHPDITKQSAGPHQHDVIFDAYLRSTEALLHHNAGIIHNAPSPPHN